MPDTDYHPDEESEELARKLAFTTVEGLRSQSSREPGASTVSLEMNHAVIANRNALKTLV